MEGRENQFNPPQQTWQHRLLIRLHQWLPGGLKLRCRLCGLRHPAHQSIAGLLCPGCYAELPWIQRPCGLCGIDLAQGEFCGECLRSPPPFASCYSPLSYRWPINSALQAFKQGQQLWLAPVFSALIAQNIPSRAQPDLICCVPQHWRRAIHRGFNPADMIARDLSRRLHLPYQVDLLRRCKAGSPQQGLDRRARVSNLRGAFTCQRNLQDLHLVLVDDVVTTTATAAECSRALLAAGAQSVNVWALARTPKSI